MSIQAISFAHKLSQLSELWTPKVIARMNDYHIKVAKIDGEFVWHEHSDTDEVFIVLQGSLRIDFREGSVELKAGEMYVVPRGVAHKPSADSEAHILLMEPAGVVNTGAVRGELTAPVDDWI
ncbi:MAG: cupin domain-containing protein [Pseudomonadota bacterium]